MTGAATRNSAWNPPKGYPEVSFKLRPEQLVLCQITPLPASKRAVTGHGVMRPTVGIWERGVWVGSAEEMDFEGVKAGLPSAPSGQFFSYPLVLQNYPWVLIV